MVVEEYRVTIIGVVSACIIYVTSVIFDLDLFESFVAFVDSLEAYEADELVFPVLLVFMSVLADVYRRKKQAQINEERLKVLTGVMINVDHLLRNLLNTLYYFKDIMQSSNDIADTTVELLDRVIDETAKELTILSKVKEIPDDAAEKGVIENKLNF